MAVKLTPGTDRHHFDGVGVNWFDFHGIGGGYPDYNPRYRLDTAVVPPLDDAAGWAAVLDELTFLRPAYIRFGLPPDAHVDGAGRLRTESVHLARLDRLNAWALANDCTLHLDTFLIPKHYQMDEPPGLREVQDQVSMAARDNEAYARQFVAPLVAHVVQDRNHQAVRHFNPVNEPMDYGVYQTPDNRPDVVTHYVDMYRQMRQALNDRGVNRSRVGLIGGDPTSAEAYKLLDMHARGIDIDPYLDVYSLHFYGLRFDHLPARSGTLFSSPLQDIERHAGKLARHARYKGKPFWVCEVGTFYYGWRDHDPAGVCSLEGTLTVAETVIRGMNVGMQLFAYWELFDPNTNDGHWRLLGWDGGRLQRGTGYNYAVHSLFMRFARPRSVVTPLRSAAERPFDLPHLHATALDVGADRLVGPHVLFVVNDHPTEPRRFDLDLPAGWRGLPERTATTARDQLAVEQPSRATVHAGRASDELPPMSVRAYYDLR